MSAYDISGNPLYKLTTAAITYRIHLMSLVPEDTITIIGNEMFIRHDDKQTIRRYMSGL